MPTIAVTDLPDDLYRKLQERAAVSGRTIEQAVQDLIARALALDDAEEAKLLAEARADRERRPDLFVTESELQRMKRWGRE